MSPTSRKRPVVYIASPYTNGDVAVNTHFQCKIFDRLLGDGLVIPVAPLWTHFQHTLFPRPYKMWIEYDRSLLHLYDACLRLTATSDSIQYEQFESKGADAEVDIFRQEGKPVFFSVDELYTWVQKGFANE